MGQLLGFTKAAGVQRTGAGALIYATYMYPVPVPRMAHSSEQQTWQGLVEGRGLAA